MCKTYWPTIKYNVFFLDLRIIKKYFYCISAFLFAPGKNMRSLFTANDNHFIFSLNKVSIGECCSCSFPEQILSDITEDFVPYMRLFAKS